MRPMSTHGRLLARILCLSSVPYATLQEDMTYHLRSESTLALVRFGLVDCVEACLIDLRGKIVSCFQALSFLAIQISRHKRHLVVLGLLKKLGRSTVKTEGGVGTRKVREEVRD